VLQIWKNYITELYDRPNQPETLEVEPEEEIDTDKKGPYILQNEIKKTIKKMRTRRLQEMIMYLEMCSNYWEKIV
jgi:hypothetical protein